MENFKNVEIQEKGHVSRDFIHNLIIAGVIKPTVSATGQGKSREFNEAAFLEILICRELWLYGFKPEMMKPVIKALDAKELFQKVNENKDPQKKFFLDIKKARVIREGKGYIRTGPWPHMLITVSCPEDLGSLVSRGSHLLINLHDLVRDIQH